MKNLSRPWASLLPLTALLAGGPYPLVAGPAVNEQDGYQTNYLVSDLAHAARFRDPRLGNPWGLVVTPYEAIVADNHSGLLTSYNLAGADYAVLPRSQVYIPGPAGSTNPGAPSGIILNPTTHFVIHSGPKSKPASILVVTEDGTILGYHSGVKLTNAVIVVDNSASGAVYKGIAMAWTTNSTNIYVANFHSGMIETYGPDFTFLGGFTDGDPALAGYGPYNLIRVQDKLIVSYAKQDDQAHDNIAGVGLGYIDIFNPDGTLVRRLASQGALDGPWGMAVAPRHFGRFGHALLVGNFGDSTINAYNLLTGEYLGSLENKNGNPLTIDGLWGLAFSAAQDNDDLEYESSRLFFTAGPNDENDGLFGYINALHPFIPPVH